MHSAWNGNIIVCRQILLAKLRCKMSFCRKLYLSWKYNISDCDWYANITCLMGNVKIKQTFYPVSHDASVLHDLCSMRDDDFCKMFTKTQLDQLIFDISINYLHFCLYIIFVLVIILFFLYYGILFV